MKPKPCTDLELKAMSMNLAKRWNLDQRERALAIVNDIAEDIDNHESRAELRQALAIYADILCDAMQRRQDEKDKELGKDMLKIRDLVSDARWDDQKL